MYALKLLPFWKHNRYSVHSKKLIVKTIKTKISAIWNMRFFCLLVEEPPEYIKWLALFSKGTDFFFFCGFLTHSQSFLSKISMFC
jgi:hypothetical protein